MRTRWDNRQLVTVTQVFILSDVFLAVAVIIAKTSCSLGKRKNIPLLKFVVIHSPMFFLFLPFIHFSCVKNARNLKKKF